MTRAWLGAAQWFLSVAAGLGLAALRRPLGRVAARGRQIAPALGLLVFMGLPSMIGSSPGPLFAAAFGFGLSIALLGLTVSRRWRRPWFLSGVSSVLRWRWRLSSHGRRSSGARSPPGRCCIRPSRRFWRRHSSSRANASSAWIGSAPPATTTVGRICWIGRRLTWGCSRGYEDLGGYEPAQSKRYRAFMDALHGESRGGGCPRNILAWCRSRVRARGSMRPMVRAALMPRWGMALFAQWRDGDGVAPPLRLTRPTPLTLLAADVGEGRPAAAGWLAGRAVTAPSQGEFRPLGPAADHVTSGADFPVRARRLRGGPVDVRGNAAAAAAGRGCHCG